MVIDPILTKMANPSYNDFCGCGLMATGNEVETDPIPEENVTTKVVNLRTWQYVRMGLMLVGVYVVAGWIYKKLK